MVDFHAVKQVLHSQHRVLAAVLFPAAVGMGQSQLAGRGAGGFPVDPQNLDFRHGVPVQLDGGAGLPRLVQRQEQEEVRLLVVEVPFRGFPLKLVHAHKENGLQVPQGVGLAVYIGDFPAVLTHRGAFAGGAALCELTPALVPALQAQQSRQHHQDDGQGQGGAFQDADIKV